MITCTKCGKENMFEGAKFCSSCGAELAKPEAAEAPKDQNLILESSDDDWMVQEEQLDSASSHTEGEPGSKTHQKEENIIKENPTEPIEIPESKSEPQDSPAADSPTPAPAPTASSGPPNPGSVDKDPISIQNPIESLFEEDLKTNISPTVKVKVKHPTPAKNSFDPETQIEPGSPKSKPTERKKDIEKEKLESTSTFVVEPHVHKSKGIAYLEGSNIKLTGGIKVFPGDEIKVGEHDFVLKEKVKNRWPIYGAIFFAIVAIGFLSITLWSSGQSKNNGSIIGIVVEQGSRSLVPQVSIRIKELGKKVNTNEMGFFNFEFIPPGTYTLEAASAGYSPVQDNAIVFKKQITNMALVLSPQRAGTASPSLRSSVTVPQITTPSRTPGTATTVSTAKTGSLNIRSNVANSYVLLDDKMIGRGDGTYKNIPVGEHTVRVTRQGYSEFETKVDIIEKSTTQLNVALQKTTKTTSAPLTADEYFSKASDDFNTGNYSKAATGFTQALNLRPNYPDAYYKRAESYLNIGDKRRATDDFVKAAKSYKERDDYPSVIKSYSQVLSINSSHLTANYERGNAYLQTKEYDKAIADLKKAVDINPKFFNAFIQLGYAYYKVDNFEEGLNALDKAVKLNPNNYQPYVRYAKIYSALGDKSGCKKNYKKVRELSTYVDRENLKQDPEWREVLDFVGEKDE